MSEERLLARRLSVGRPSQLERLVLTVMGAILLCQLIVPPIVGLANNGDFEKLMGEAGLNYAATMGYSDRYFNYINTEFLVVPRNWWKSGLITSERLFLEMALLINRVVSKNGLFDIRVLGVVHVAGFLVGIWLILVGSRGLGKPYRYVLASLLVFCLTDVGYVSYFNSMYCEPASLIFLCWTVGFALIYVTRSEPNVPTLVMYFGAAMLFAAAKTQNSVLGVLLALFGIRLSWRLHQRRWRSAIWGLGLGCCLLSVVLFLGWRPYTREANLYNVVFYEILRNSSSPQEDLRELGLRSDFVEYSGTYSYMEEAPVADPGFRASFFDNIGYGKILGFYAHHPSRLVSLAQRAAGQSFSLRPELGNLEKSVGLPPYGKSQAFDQWSRLRAWWLPDSLWFLVGFLVANVGIALIAIMRRTVLHTSPSQPLLELLAVLAIMVFVQFFAVILAEGELDLVRHMFLFNTMFDFILMGDLVLVAGFTYSISRPFRQLWITAILEPDPDMRPQAGS